MVFIDNNEIKLSHEDITKSAVKQIQFSSEDDINMILVYRSLYLLKRKFEIYEKEVQKVYLKHKEVDRINLIIEKEKFVEVVKDVFKECNFSFAEISKPNELFRAELVSQINDDKIKIILDLFDKFMKDNRDKYNEIMKKKKFKSFDKDEDANHVVNKEESIMGIIEQNEEELDDDKKFDVHAKSVLEKSNETLEQENKDETNKEGEPEMNKEGDKPEMNEPEVQQPETNTERRVKKQDTLEQELFDRQEVELNPDAAQISNQDIHITKREFLLIEALPLIIADFLSENQNLVLADFNEDMRDELRTLFDNEILQRLGEEIKHDINLEREAKLKDLLFEKLNIENNIKTYENVLVEKGSKRENTIFIEKMLHKLREQKAHICKKIKNIQEDNDTQNNHQVLHIDTTPKAVNITQIPKKKSKNY
jgi:hypothetical protein